MPERNDQKPRGIADAAMKGARQGEQDDQKAEPDSKVSPNAPSSNTSTENNEAPMGGAPVAFPAPSAQPTRTKPTERRAAIEVKEEEDTDPEWQRAGGGNPKKQ
jgi:hypothetical protein